MVYKKTFDTYRTVAKNCLANHKNARPEGMTMPIGALKVRREGKTEAYNEMAKALTDLGKSHPIPRKIPRSVHRTTDEALGILLSDLHVGKFAEIDNEVVFSVDIAIQRIKQIVQNARHLWDDYMREVHHIEDIHLFLVGDIIDGEQIYATQTWNSELPVIKQVSLAAEVLKTNLLAWASKEFSNVWVHSVQGNHGEIRTSGGSTAFHWQTNFDTLLAKMLEFGCSSLDNVFFDIGYDQLHIARIPKYKSKDEHKFFLMHKTPQHPQTAAGRSKFGGWLQRFGVDAFLTGHYHNARFENFNGVPIAYNGALFGSADDYTMNLAFDGFPSQLLFSISDKRPLAHWWLVDLR